MEQILIDDKHEYDYRSDCNARELYYSNTSVDWTCPGDLGMQIIDDGNGLSVMDEDKQIVFLQYDTAEMLGILLRLINRGTTYEVVTKKERI